jgi:hypothetical protein
MIVRPITLDKANEFVTKHHRHSKRTAGHRFSIGLELNGELVGVAIVGRPVARRLDDGWTAEINRLCVNADALPYACSKLYRACVRAWAAMGGRKIITYTLQKESGASLRGAGFKCTAEVRAGEWSVPSRPRGTQEVYKQDKFKWEIDLQPALQPRRE